MELVIGERGLFGSDGVGWEEIFEVFMKDMESVNVI